MAQGNCARCGTFRKWLHRHRVIPGSEGGKYEEGNIELICANCHEDEHDSPFGQIVRARRRRADRETAIPRDELVRLYEDEGLTIREIADHLGTAPSNIHFWLTDYGIERRSGAPPRIDAPDGVDLAALYERNTSIEIADMFEVSPLVAQRWLREAGVTLRQRGERPDDEVLDLDGIQRVLNGSSSVAEAARKIGMAETTLHGVMRREGLHRPTGQTVTKREVEAAYGAAGFKIQGLADAFDVSYSTANRWLTEYGIKRRGKRGRPAGGVSSPV